MRQLARHLHGGACKVIASANGCGACGHEFHGLPINALAGRVAASGIQSRVEGAYI